jgi:aminocarboxymuconate-semialdehyde decarboxylase
MLETTYMNHGVTGVRHVDVHAHFFPQAYLDVLAAEGPRFNVEYRTAGEGFYIKTEARFQGPLSYRIVDLKKRISDMDAQGMSVQAMSLTGPMAHWGDEEVSLKLARAWNDGASAAHVQYPTRLFGLLTLPMLFPDRAIDELNRATKLPGIKGVYMGTNINQPISTTRRLSQFLPASRLWIFLFFSTRCRSLAGSVPPRSIFRIS